jgi:periplasmic copper chaperone A
MRRELSFVIVRRALMLFAAGLFCVSLFGAEGSEIVVHDAWIRVPAPSKTETALYMVIENHGAQKKALVSASSDWAGAMEMHQMRMDGKVMVMMPAPNIMVPARGKATLSPNGYHMMMYRLKTRPAVGDTVDVILKFDDGTSLNVTATVKK